MEYRDAGVMEYWSTGVLVNRLNIVHGFLSPLVCRSILLALSSAPNFQLASTIHFLSSMQMRSFTLFLFVYSVVKIILTPL